MRDSAAAIIVGSRATWQQLGDRWIPKTVYIPENAISPETFPEGENRPPPAPLRVIFVGRLVPYKCADMLLEACADLVKAGKVRLEIVGDGPQKCALETSVVQQGLCDGVTFTGWLDRAGVAARLRQSHVLGFPSIREFGGGVVLEAMASGVVPIVVDYAGPAELVTHATGYLVPLSPRRALVAALRAQLERLVESPHEVAAKAICGRARVKRCFTWDRKAEQVSAVYSWILQRGAKPEFGMPFPD
jgi:glycosyltransferase involved in cell wall biosynthesis